jgi:hypothetical protein
LISALAWTSLALGEEAFAPQAAPTHAVVYTARIPIAAGAKEEDYERIAREKGSIEVFTFAEDGHPDVPADRHLVRLGEPGFAYPGLSVSIRKALNDAVAGGVFKADQGGMVFQTADSTSRQYVECRLPGSPGTPLTAQVMLDGELQVKIVQHEVSLSRSGSPWPSVLVMSVPHKGDTIRIYEYRGKPGASALKEQALNEVPLPP